MELIACTDYAHSRGLPLATIRRYCRNGTIPCLTVGRAYMIAPEIADKALTDLMHEKAHSASFGGRAKKKFKNKGFNGYASFDEAVDAL